MDEEKLNIFALLSIEHEVLINLNVDEIIDYCIDVKNRMKIISTTSSSRASSVVLSFKLGVDIEIYVNNFVS